MLDIDRHLYSGLFVDYLSNKNEIEEFFRYTPRDISSFKTRIKEVYHDYSREKRSRLVESLEEYNKNIFDHYEVEKSLEKLKSKDSTVVITGQQPGLLAGPLFTVYKVLTAIKLAENIENLLNRPVVPLFWLASEDHDFSEVNFFNLRDPKGHIQEFKLFEKKYNINSPIGDVHLNAQGDRFLDKMTSYIENNLQPPPEFYEKWTYVYREGLKKSAYLSTWTAYILMHLFAHKGLLVVDPLQKNIKEMAAEKYLQAVDLKDSLYNEVTKKGDELSEYGYLPGLELQENHSGLFFHLDSARKALICDNKSEGYKTRDKEIFINNGELKKKINSSPHNFSPNVSLRPIVQDHIFPTLAYVAGPGEVNYFAQLKGVYDLFEVKMPVIYPRERHIIIEPEVNDIMNKYNISLEDVFFSWEEKKEDILLSYCGLDVKEIFKKATRNIKSEHQEIIQKLSREFLEIKNLEEKNWKLIEAQLNYLENKSRQYNKLNHKEIKKKLDFVKLSLYPYGRLQERMFSTGEHLLYYDDKILKKIFELSLEPDKISFLNI